MTNSAPDSTSPSAPPASERKVAFVTGASRGIGRAAAGALAAAGFDVVVTARTVQEGEQYDYGSTRAQSKPMALPGSIELTAEEVRGFGREALAIRLDLMDRDSIDAALDRTYAEWGHIDVLLNNGIYQGPGLMELFSNLRVEEAETIFEGNVFAQIHITQRVLSGMLSRGRGGHIINMTSGSALIDPPAPAGDGGWGFAYAASKAAFHKLAGILHVEHNADGIRSFNVNPGFILTEAQKAMHGGDQFGGTFAGAGPEVPAAVIAWLATHPDADALSGGRHVDAQRLCEERELVPGFKRADGR
jgi:NAD(P)-dependent dehydrogenase (short-subunit alcohol dehydrogenase family)